MKSVKNLVGDRVWDQMRKEHVPGPLTGLLLQMPGPVLASIAIGSEAGMMSVKKIVDDGMFTEAWNRTEKELPFRLMMGRMMNRVGYLLRDQIRAQLKRPK